MNNGKICVSVCAETTTQVIENIKRAAEYADVVELRFDCLSETEIQKTNFKLPDFTKQFLVTFRPREQGGKRDLTLYERLKFWQFILWKNRRKKFLIDTEFDINSALNPEKIQTIISYHDFAGNSENLSAVYEFFKQTSDKIIKLAVQTDDITDSLTVWKLLEKAKSDNRQIIPIAMGEGGKWTRILGLAHGAFMTYASLDAGSETAPGQISAADLTEVYRVKELNEQTEIYGIVGGNTSYSTSPYMHNAAFKFLNLNAVYVPFQTKILDDFINVFLAESGLNIKGFSVTIPHKEAIIQYLDELDETARKIGAVNTVKIENGKLCGYNTDAHGFIEPLRNFYGDLQNAKVAVLGAGGAARACVYALTQEKAHVTIYARDLRKAEFLADEFQVELKEFPKTKNQKPKTNLSDFDILVNTTPLGTKGDLETETPAAAAQIESVKLIYDLVYNPFQTLLMTEADKANVPKIGGMAMLVAQGMKQFEIWTGKNAPMKEMSRAVLERLG
jgi:3-dehydroquinate dehydratase/shikimate dehydrogenase